ITKFGQKPHTSFDYSDQNEDYFFVFGRETNGLPKELIEQNMDRCLRLPMTEHVRSLNLSNTAAILVYEALRQQNYRDLT
ncbi:tRNA (cytidine(34)-2'-O)-methyltransferase, partial [Bacillus haynesii]